MKNQLIITHGKLLSKLSQMANLGNGSTWPGHIALKINPKFIKQTLKHSSTKIIFVVGTNGKTTTASLLTHLLRSDHKKVIQNTSGANLINGIASTILLNSNYRGKLTADYVIFEIDENAFPLACKEVTPDIIVVLNLFRDQLDRYGEVNTIALNWSKAIAQLPGSTKLFLNADDPQIAFLGHNVSQKVYYFGIDEKGSDRADNISDSSYCPLCGNKLKYKKTYYSHLGDWYCPTGDLKRAKSVTASASHYPLDGMYNHYNTIDASLTAEHLGIPAPVISAGLASFKPAFGRQEKMTVDGRTVEVILAKNPAGFNQTLQTVLSLKGTNLLLALNDRIADGTDVSWIWDIDFEMLQRKKMTITVTGDRVYDLALRLKYAEVVSSSIEGLSEAIKIALKQTPKDETLYIIPTYTAMLDIRKVLTGKKIL